MDPQQQNQNQQSASSQQTGQIPAGSQTNPAAPAPGTTANVYEMNQTTYQPQQTTPSQAAPPQTAGQGGTITGQAQTNPNSTQNSLLISEVRDGVVILKDGGYRAVVLAQSINFDLMSPQERDGVEQSYQGFLNSLYFPIQIMLRSQRVDLRSYLDNLDSVRQNQSNTLLSLLMEDYIAYIEYLSQTSNIMEKQFFVVIPFDPPITQNLANKASKFGGIFKKTTDIITISEEDFINAKTELKNRVQAVLESMNQMGVQAIPLNTQELLELYYDVYNPDTATVQPLIDYHKLDGIMVEKGVGESPYGGQR